MRPRGKLSTWLSDGLDEHRRFETEAGSALPAPEPEIGKEISGEREIPPYSSSPSDRPPPSRLPESYTRSRSSGARIMLGLVANPYKR